MKSTPLNRTERVVVETKIGRIVFKSIDRGTKFRVESVGRPDLMIYQYHGSDAWFARVKGDPSPALHAKTPEKAFKMMIKHYWN